MTRLPPQTPPETDKDDRFTPIEEVEIPAAEILGELQEEGREPLESHFPVLHEAEPGPTVRGLSKEPSLSDPFSLSAAVLKSRGLRDQAGARGRPYAGLWLPVLAGSGPPLPVLLVAVLLLLALAL